jgi:outer membrane protein OmpA-like peptidoglycan-associated protein
MMARDVRILFAMLCALSPLVLLAGAAGAEPQSRNMIVAQDSGDTSAEPEEKHKRKKKDDKPRRGDNPAVKSPKAGRDGAVPAVDAFDPPKREKRERKPKNEREVAPASPFERREKEKFRREKAEERTKPAFKPAGDAAPPVVDGPENDDRKSRFSKDRDDDRRKAKPAKDTAPPVVAPPVVGAPDSPEVDGAGTVKDRFRFDRDRRNREPKPTKDANRRSDPKEVKDNYVAAPKPVRSFEDLKRNRKERVIGDGKLRVIEEPDRRVIVKQDNRVFIRHDDSDRFRRIAPDARTIRRADGTSTTFMTRRGGVRIYDVTDRHGRLLYRYRRYPGGREVMLIDNRRYYRRNNDRTRDILIGAGIGLVVGSAIALAAPEVRIPRDEYIVDYGRATDDDIYEALIAPPIERLDRGYSLEEIRYSRYLRDRMRRVDLDTVTFDFGSWEVAPDQERALDRMAEGINRALERNPDEIFMIEGHTDAVGAEEDNLMLSDRRAQSVAEILTTAYGVPPENLITQGYGEEQLKIPTDGPERANRRITVRRIGPLLTGRADEGPGGPEGPDGPDGPYEDDR